MPFDTPIKIAFSTPWTIIFSFQSLGSPRIACSGASRSPSSGVQHRFREAFEALQSASKHLQHVPIGCFGIILFQNSFFNYVFNENTVFEVSGSLQKAPESFPEPSKSASKRFQTLQGAFKDLQDITSVCILQ